MDSTYKNTYDLIPSIGLLRVLQLSPIESNVASEGARRYLIDWFTALSRLGQM
jgi:hypothetical protein